MFETFAKITVSAALGVAVVLTAAVVLVDLAGVKAGAPMVQLELCSLADGKTLESFPAAGGNRSFLGAFWIDPAMVQGINPFAGIECVKLTTTAGQIHVFGTMEYVYCKLYGGPVCERSDGAK